MNDSPGWTSPGSSSSEPGPGSPGQEPTAGQPGQAEPDGRTASPVSWSKQQPPAGQWTAPTTPGPTPPGGPGAGGQAGWGYGWGQPPIAAKPGVIPLRPLGVGEILDGAVSTMRTHWRTVLGISLAVAVLTQTVSVLVAWASLRDFASLENAGSDPAPPFEAFNAGNSVGGVIGMFGTIIATAMLTIVVSRAVLGRPVSAAEAWRDTRPQLLRLFGLLFLMSLIVFGVFAVGLGPTIYLAVQADAPAPLALLGGLVAVVVVVWLWVRFSLAAPALMLEKQKVIASMRRSAKLVRGAWWRVFGIELLALILVWIVSSIIQVPTLIIAMVTGGGGLMDWMSGGTAVPGWTFLIIASIGAVISSTVTLPISAGVTVLLYVDQRIRREALDLELARAAGVTGTIPQQPGGPQPHDSTPGS